MNYGIVKNILPVEKSTKTIGRPIVPFRKVLDGSCLVISRILYYRLQEDKEERN
jgi:hypothetical protein